MSNTDVQGIAAGQLRSIVERIERLEEEKAAIADDIKDVYGEAKGNGFDTKVLRQIIRLRKQDPNERAEQEAIKDLYWHALGMAADPDVLIPDDPEARASRALAKADEKIRRRRARQEE